MSQKPGHQVMVENQTDKDSSVHDHFLGQKIVTKNLVEKTQEKY